MFCIFFFFFFFFSYLLVDFDMAIIPEDGIVAIQHGNIEGDLMPLQRALPPSTEESMALALESPPSPNSMLFLIVSTLSQFSILTIIIYNSLESLQENYYFLFLNNNRKSFLTFYCLLLYLGK